ncbi:hypothetical protein L7F22_023385 [Adiantum nelumboides]|nr:hypothetical protein [Adiantum nelumboides]
MDSRRSPSSLLSKLLQHDPFHDPFFRSTPFSSFFDSPFLSPPQIKQGDLRIEEVPAVEGISSSRRRAPSPMVEHPDDVHVQLDSLDRGRRMQMPNAGNHEEAYTFSCSSVCYDGPKGAYYAATKTKRGGPQGVVEERFEEQDSTTNKHTKRMSRGLGNKGHSFTCEKDIKTGKVEENEFLHNLAQEEVHKFDRKWEQEAEKCLPGWRQNKNLNLKSKGLQSGRSMKALPSKS